MSTTQKEQERIELIERTIKDFLRQRELSVDNRMNVQKIVDNVYYVDVDITDVEIIDLDQLIMTVHTFKSLRAYQMVTGKFILRFVFDFLGVLYK